MDQRVFVRCGLHATTAIAAVTAQNLDGVVDVAGIPSASVVAQIEQVLAGFDVRAAKTGMLWSEQTVHAVAAAWPDGIPLVVDPVMVATSGARLLTEGAEDAYRRALAPRAALLTPNLDEAAVLLDRERLGRSDLGRPDLGRSDLRRAAEDLAAAVGCAVLLKGGHLEGDPIDVLCHASGVTAWRHPRIADVNTHGTGCMLSAAIAAGFALGEGLEEACHAGLGFVHAALERAARVGLTATTSTSLAGVERATRDGSALRRVDV